MLVHIPNSRVRLFSAALLLLFSENHNAPVQESPAPAAKPAVQSHMRLAWRRFDYTCDNGANVTIRLRRDVAQVSFGDQLYSLKQVESASGTKYSDGSIAWWSKSEEGFLQKVTSDGKAEKLADHCHMVIGISSKPAHGPMKP